MSTPTPTVVEVNCETGETVERPMTVDELAVWQADQDTAAARAAQPAPPTLQDTLAAAVAAGVAAAVPTADTASVQQAALDALTPTPPAPTGPELAAANP